MNIELLYELHAQRIALQFAARRDEAKAAMAGFDVEGNDARALTSRALVAAFIAAREAR